MSATECLVFPPFRLDPDNEQLWRNDTLVSLPPKTFAILRYLVEHAGQLVTKDELLTAVWASTRVSDGIIRGYIRDLRDALEDDSQKPRFIETVPRRGYRFIGPVVSKEHNKQGAESKEQGAKIELRVPAPSTQHPTPLLVGREAELVQLQQLLDKALSGVRQIVFVTGEPGIGKTALVEAFLAETRDWRLETNPSPQQASSPKPLASSFWLGRGQSVEQHGAGEAYLPVLEALGRIGREPGGEPFVATLQQYAPTWLVQMPALITAAELEALQRRVVGASRERMLREMVEAIEVLTAQRPLVLWFEDLHWADASTVDWLAAIAQQTAPARLFVIGSYRPSDLSLSNHPLRAVKQELVGKGKCKELLIPFLATDHVTQYLTRRYPRHQFPPELSTTIHQSTDGNPLFVVNMVDYLTAQGMIAEVDGRWQLRSRVEDITRSVPDSVRQLIEKQVEQLREEEQLLLEVASVAGVMFSAPAVAAGVEAPVGQVEKACDGLVKRGQFLQTQEPRELPNGTLCGSYGFQHALQHAVVYERTPRLRRLRLHRQIGESQEQQYGKYASLIAAELAMHFERGGDLPRAVQYHQRAGHNALRQHGYQEASNHFRRGLDLLATLPDTAERRQQELALLVALGSPLQAQHGYGAAEVEAVYTRARELSQHIGETAQLFPVLRGLYVFYLLRGKIQTAHELGERLLSLAQRVQDSALLLEAHFAVGQTLLFRGEFIAAQEHFEHGIAIYDPVRHRSHAFLYGHDPGVFCRVLAAWNLCFLGYSDQAVKRNQEALAVAKAVDHPLSVAAAQAFFAMTHQFRREGAPAQAHAEAAVELSAQQGFPYFLAYGTILRGWALVEQGYLQEGIAQLRQGLTSYRATGAELAMTRIVALLAEAWGKSGQPEEGLHTLTEAFTIITSGGERDYEAEIYRLKGELTLQKQFGVRSPKSKEERQKAKGNTQKGDIGIRNWELGFSFLPSPSPNPKSQIRDPASEAGECFLKAIEVARGQQAKSLELRAVMSLVRLRQWQVQSAPRTTQHVPRDRLAEAHRMLSDLYGWFTEGFATKDLQEAKALLDSLKSQKV